MGVVFFAAACIFVTFAVGPYYKLIYMIGDSMDPTVEHGRILIVKRALKEYSPRRYDVVAIEDVAAGDLLVKRVLALPGEWYEIREGVVYLNGNKRMDLYGHGKISFDLVDTITNEYLRYWSGPDKGEVVIELVDQKPEQVPLGHVWVIGDNRKDSWFGLLPIGHIRGTIAR